MKLLNTKALMAAFLLPVAAIAAPQNRAWLPVARSGSRTLLFNQAASALSLSSSSDHSGQKQVRLNFKVPGFRPAALDGNRILVQEISGGALVELSFDETGALLSEKQLWNDSRGWIVRGASANRIVLEHTQTRDVAIWVQNPKLPLFRSYYSFTLPAGWNACGIVDDSILVQEESTGIIEAIELGDEYKPSGIVDLAARQEKNLL